MIGSHDPLYDGYINDWSVSFPMKRDGKSYTPDLTSFNKKITDKGGVAISGNVILGSTINSNAIYCLDSQTGMVSGKGKTFADAKVRAIMAF